ncbi:MAG TPA: hypothetical protein VKP65_06720 [Rhodothermales bacterium]|nr:hypothetical protein [Rhodothermales bacterium]
MATRTTKKTKRSTSRKKPAQNATRRKKRTAQRRQRAASFSKALQRSSGATKLPGWKELASSNGRVKDRPAAGAFMEKVSTVQFALLLLFVAVSITLYVGHVQATQEVLSEMQQARKENLRLHLKLNRLKGDFDRTTGPAVVYQRAKEIGLEEGIAYGPTIKEEE